MEYTAPTRKLLEQYDIEATDLMYCTLLRSGWGKHEAVFYAYHLQWFDLAKINVFIRERTKARPGIITLINDNTAQDRAAAKELRDLKDKLKQQKKRQSTSKPDDSIDPDKMSKEELGRMYCQIMRDNSSDDKTRMDAAKAYSSLFQLQKEQTEEEDNRINFYLPPNCHYCDRCKNCELKRELEERGCKVRAKKTSPYLWQVVKPSDDDSEFINPSINEQDGV